MISHGLCHYATSTISALPSFSFCSTNNHIEASGSQDSNPSITTWLHSLLQAGKEGHSYLVY